MDSWSLPPVWLCKGHRQLKGPLCKAPPRRHKSACAALAVAAALPIRLPDQAVHFLHYFSNAGQLRKGAKRRSQCIWDDDRTVTRIGKISVMLVAMTWSIHDYTHA